MFQEMYNTRDLVIARVINQDNFREVLIKHEYKKCVFYEMLPSRQLVLTSDLDNIISFNLLFPDLKRVSLPQIVNIVKDLHTGDEIERDARRLLMK